MNVDRPEAVMISAGDFQALVALRLKQGEFMALQAVQDDRGVQPLLEFEVPEKSLETQLRYLEQVARQFHAFGRLVMVDASALEAAPTFGGEQQAGLGSLADRLGAPENLLAFPEQIPFVPVVGDGLAANQLAWTGRLCAELGAGGALRVKHEAFMTGEIERLLKGLELAVGDVDLILDLGYLESITAELADSVLSAFEAARTVGPFRSRTLLSGSIPSTLERTALWERPRFEEALWGAVVDGGGRDIRLGDYGVVYPRGGKLFPSKHVNMKYTCPEHWLFGRERMADSKKQASTLEIVCRNLVESESFSGPEFSWGDQEIANAANGTGTGNSLKSKPIAIGTSHHLAYLASLQAA
ncbi:hypothetical protein AB0P21_27915 [Kribbella sp. NPDC056861]|uniref:beta family protein n=1 Tax=Kribbella sp. NPDC056861 TaxID=3154857 RepID=UPI003414B153